LPSGSRKQHCGGADRPPHLGREQPARAASCAADVLETGTNTVAISVIDGIGSCVDILLLCSLVTFPWG
jgi:hypothetical protein